MMPKRPKESFVVWRLRKAKEELKETTEYRVSLMKELDRVYKLLDKQKARVNKLIDLRYK